MKSAEETKAKVDVDLKELEKTLDSIETARPFNELDAVSVHHPNDDRITALGGADIPVRV